mmetsp:Transcript_17520/g.54308  ORF Transcript_17520/g.54308 Transcript_17520/m.54308 type:complete len:405 (+) Transcript_17520:1689-2903(+)
MVYLTPFTASPLPGPCDLPGSDSLGGPDQKLRSATRQSASSTMASGTPANVCESRCERCGLTAIATGATSASLPADGTETDGGLCTLKCQLRSPATISSRPPARLGAISAMVCGCARLSRKSALSRFSQSNTKISIEPTSTASSVLSSRSLGAHTEVHTHAPCASEGRRATMRPDVERSSSANEPEVMRSTESPSRCATRSVLRTVAGSCAMPSTSSGRLCSIHGANSSPATLGTRTTQRLGRSTPPSHEYSYKSPAVDTAKRLPAVAVPAPASAATMTPCGRLCCRHCGRRRPMSSYTSPERETKNMLPVAALEPLAVAGAARPSRAGGRTWYHACSGVPSWQSIVSHEHDTGSMKNTKSSPVELMASRASSTRPRLTASPAPLGRSKDMYTHRNPFQERCVT